MVVLTTLSVNSKAEVAQLNSGMVFKDKQPCAFVFERKLNKTKSDKQVFLKLRKRFFYKITDAKVLKFRHFVIGGRI